MNEQSFYFIVGMLANTTATYKRSLSKAHLLTAAENFAKAFCDGSHYKPYDISATRDKSMMHFTFDLAPAWTLSCHHIQFDVCVPVSGTIWYVTSSVIDEEGNVLPMWGTCKFCISKFSIPSYIVDILAEVEKKYHPMKQKELAGNDSELARVQSFIPALEKKFKDIQAFCKKNKLALWLDTSVESTGSLEVLPAGTEAVEGGQEFETDLAYDQKAIPVIDIGVSCYDYFSETLVRPNGKS